MVGDLHPYYTYQLSLQAVTIAAGPISPTINITMQEDGEYYKALFYYNDYDLKVYIPICVSFPHSSNQSSSICEARAY